MDSGSQKSGDVAWNEKRPAVILPGVVEGHQGPSG